MNTLTRNFTHTFKRFLSTSLLNILGLSIAFASFFVIMTQVDYDYNYNKGYKNYQHIFRVEIYPNAEYGWQVYMPRPLGEIIGQCSPHIQATSLMITWSPNDEFHYGEHQFFENITQGFEDFLQVFQPEMLCGSTEALTHSRTILISQSLAMRLFQTTDAVGKTILQGRKNDNKELVIGGVYKDMPENSQLENSIFRRLDPYENKDSWENWNYVCYIRLDHPDAIEEVERIMEQKIKELDLHEDECHVRFTPLADVHFKEGVDGSDSSNRNTMYLLLCISFLIVFVATVNYMNFSLAETPMRIKSINTQKVLGANTGTLRSGLVAEAVLVSLLSFLLALLWIYVLKENGLQELVQSRLQLLHYPKLLAVTFALSILMGILAGIYPSYYVTSFPPALALKGSFGLSPKGRALRTTLVCFQFIVSFMLIIGVGIMYQQSRYIHQSDYGYDKNEILIGKASKEVLAQKKAVINELLRLPGVENVSFSNFRMSSSDGYMTWGRGSDDKRMNFTCMPIDTRYLQTMGIKLTEGRNFKESDKNVYIFNEAARKKYSWIKVGEPINPNDYRVVGFCENVKFSSFRNDDNESPLAFFYEGEDGNWFTPTTMNIRTEKGADKLQIMKELQHTLEKFTPDHDFQFQFMDTILDQNYQKEMLFTKQILLFSLIAIAICMIGVFGLTLFESEYRHKEIGIRKIMGSSTKEILYMFNRRYLIILAACYAVATPLGWWMGKQWLQNFADKTRISGWVFILSFLLVASITLATVIAQSWKNASENPINSIKSE